MNANEVYPWMLMMKCLLAMPILMLVILMLILMLINLNTGYADTDADLCIRIMPLRCTCQWNYVITLHCYCWSDFSSCQYKQRLWNCSKNASIVWQSKSFTKPYVDRYSSIIVPKQRFSSRIITSPFQPFWICQKMKYALWLLEFIKYVRQLHTLTNTYVGNFNI